MEIIVIGIARIVMFSKYWKLFYKVVLKTSKMLVVSKQICVYVISTWLASKGQGKYLNNREMMFFMLLYIYMFTFAKAF